MSRRSEYIRFKNAAKEFKTRVSKIFAFETPRSSTDTFDLSEQEEFIYDDIKTYRRNIQTHDNNEYWCCCCGRAPGDRSPARTSDEQTTRDPTDMHIQIVGEDILSIDEIVNRSIAPKPERNGSKTKKRNKKNEMEVQHVDFDDREKRIQPTTSEDVRIGVPQKPVKHINTENQLSSFGKKTVVGQKPDQTPNQDKNKEFRSATSHAVFGKTFIGIKLLQAQSMPSLIEEITTDMPESTSEEMKKERDPSYIDMSETLKTAKSDN